MKPKRQAAAFDEIHEAFRRFPEPLAVAGAAGGILQANEAWLARFGTASLALPLTGTFPAEDNSWHPARLRSPGADREFGVSARAIGGQGRLLLATGLSGPAGREGMIEDLLFRWGGEEFAVLVAGTGWRDRTVVDRRGSTDAWAKEAGRSALHLEWHEAYECGEGTIDAEHRELFALANRVIDASLDAAAGRDGVLGALDALIAHVARHFAVARHMLTMDRAFFPLFTGDAAATRPTTVEGR